LLFARTGFIRSETGKDAFVGAGSINRPRRVDHLSGKSSGGKEPRLPTLKDRTHPLRVGKTLTAKMFDMLTGLVD
jgi:hypothetical protein